MTLEPMERAEEPYDFPVPPNEPTRARLAEALLRPDMATRSALTAVVNIGCAVFDCPTAFVSLMTGREQHILVARGLEPQVIPRQETVCTNAIATGSPILTADLAADSRFRDNPHVAALGIRFYVSVPFTSDGFHHVGTVCMFDTVTRPLDAQSRAKALDLARLVEALLRGRERSEAAEAALATERQLSRAARRRLQLLRQIEDLAQIGAWSVDVETGDLEWSDKIFDIYGLPRTRPPTLDLALAHYAPEDRDHVRETVQRSMTDGVPFRFEVGFVDANGERRRVRSMGDVEAGEGGAGTLFGIFQDVTEERAREDLVAWQLEMLAQAKDAIVAHDVDGRIIYWNRQAERLYGWSVAEAMGQPVAIIVEGHEAAAFATARTLADGRWSGRLSHLNRSGQVVVVQSGQTLVRGRNGRPDSILCINTDITERLVLDEELQREGRLDAIGQLTGGIAHDFNNLLTIIIGSGDLLLRRTVDDPGTRALIQMSREAADRGRELVLRMLAFARRQELDPTPTDVHRLVLDMAELLRRGIGDHCTLELNLDPESWLALVDPAKLESALLNLCLNARDATSHTRGKVVVSAAPLTVDAARAREIAGIAPGDYIHIAVADNGTGMPPEVVRRAFDPFFTTRTGRGTGLGLSMVHGFVKQSGGHIRIETQLGRGTTIHLYLPRAMGEADGLPPAERLGDILLVEDDEGVRAYLAMVLQKLGYAVVDTGSPTRALDVLGAGQPVDLLLTDIILKGTMSGYELAEKARQLRPGLPILFSSGMADIAPPPELGAASLILRKPFQMDDLARSLRLLTEPGTAGTARGGIVSL